MSADIHSEQQARGGGERKGGGGEGGRAYLKLVHHPLNGGFESQHILLNASA